MTDMEAKARELTQGILDNPHGKFLDNLAIFALTEARREGQENPDEETRAKLYIEKIPGFENWRKYKRGIFNKGVERGMEEAAKVVDSFDAEVWSWIIAAAIREKIKESPDD